MAKRIEKLDQEARRQPEAFVAKPGTSKLVRIDPGRIPEVDVTQDDLNNATSDETSWLMYGGGYENQRHSTADVISPENVADLELEWSRDLSQIPYDIIGENGHDFQGSPLVIPGDPPIMYHTQGGDVTRALDARTGDELWTHQYRSVSQYSSEVPADRGVAVLGDTLYKATMDYGVLALDRYDGSEQWYFNGAYEYRGEQADGDPQTAVHPELTFERDRGTGSSYPVVVYEGTILKGSFGGEWGVSGWARGITTDGEEAWHFGMVPPEQWVGDSWKHGGGTVWQAPAVDPESGTAVFPTSNPGPWYGTVRPGWNQYTCGKVALDIESGEYRWHYQESPHDWWDYDSPSPALIYDAELFGEQRRLASWAGKTGWVFTADVETGKLRRRSEEFVDHVNMWDLPPMSGSLDDADWTAPDLTGGTDPQASAYDPTTQTMVVKGTNVPMKLAYNTTEYEAGFRYTGLVGPERAPPGRNIDGWNGMWGNMTGIDPVSGEVKWQNWYRDDSPWGGALTTATGLTFAGDHTGQFLALDTETGETLWQYTLPDGVDGDPISWYDPQEGKQYVAVGAAGASLDTEQGATLAVFSLAE